MEKGSVVYYNDEAAALYRTAAMLTQAGINVISSPDAHESVATAPDWLFCQENTPEKMRINHGIRESLYHENANAIVYDLDNNKCYFERLSCRSLAEDFDGDDVFSPIKSAATAAEMLEIIKITV